MPNSFSNAYSNIIITAIALILVVIIAMYSLVRHKVTGAIHLATMSFFGFIWGAFYMLELTSRTIGQAEFWHIFHFIPLGFIPPVFLIFALVFEGKQIQSQKPGWLLLNLIPFTNMAVIWTNKSHHWFIEPSLYPQNSVSGLGQLSYHYGFWFWVITGYSLLLLIISVVYLFRCFVNEPSWKHGRTGGLLIGAMLPLIASLFSIPIWLFELPTNLTLFALTGSLLIFAWSLFSDKILEVIPIARSTLINQMNDGVITLDDRGYIIDHNKAADNLPVLNIKDHLGESLVDILKPYFSLDLSSTDLICRSHEIELGNDNSGKTFELQVSPLFDETKNRAGSLVVFHEITSRKLEEVERVHIEERYRAIFENSTNGIFLLNQQGMIVENNEESTRFSGYSNQQILFRSLWDLIPDAPKIENGSNGKFPPFETTLMHASGERIPIEVNVTPIISDEESYFFVTIQDIRERKQAEATTRAALNNVQSRMDELALIRSVTDSLNQSTTLNTALLPVFEAVTSITKSQHIWLFVLEKQNHAFMHVEYHPLEENPIVLFSSKEELPKCLQRLLEGRILDPRKVKECTCSQFNVDSTHFTLPLYVGRQPLGVLNFSIDSDFQINENKIRLLHTICDSLSVAIERVRLFKSEHDQRKLAETLRDIGTTLTASLDLNEVLDLLLVQLSRLIPYDGGNVSLVDNNFTRIARVRGYDLLSKEQIHNLSQMVFNINTTSNIKEMIETKKVMTFPDTSAVKEWIASDISKFYPCWMGAPVTIEGKVEAIFSIEKKEPCFFTQEHAQLLSAFASLASLAIKNARLFTRESKRLNELDGLRATLTVINSELDVNILLKEISTRAINLLSASTAEIGLYNPVSKQIKILVSENLDKSYVGTLINLGEGIMGKVAETRSPLVVANYQIWEGRLKQYESMGAYTGLCVPMFGGNNELVGVISVGDRNLERGFTEDDIRLLNLFAQQATIAIRNAQLFEDAKRRAEEAETIRKAGAVVVSTLEQATAINLILEQLEQVVPYDSASVLLKKKNALTIVGGHGFKDVNPMIGLEFELDRKNPGAIVFLENKSCLLQNVPEEFPNFQQYPQSSVAIRSWLGVPLVIQNRPIGILSLDAHKENQFTEDHARLVGAFADQVAIALENSRLYERALESASNFETLYKLSQTISANIRSVDIYPAIHEATKALMDTEFFCISLVDEKKGTIEDVYMVDREEPVKLTSRPVTLGLFGKVYQDGKSRLYNSFSLDMVAETGAILTGDLNQDDISQSVMIVPLKIGTKMIGLISAQSYAPYAYDDNDLEMLELLAANAAIAVENARLFAEVQELAVTDPVIKIFNRRKFTELSTQEFNRARRYSHALSVLMIDIDHFKLVNDSYGHAVGDQVLQKLAVLCEAHLRTTDVLARYGGEEFVILLPETEGLDAVKTAERLREDTEYTKFETSVGAMSITISLGIASLNASCKDIEELVDRSDQAMYASKNAGRNKVTLWTTKIVPRPKGTSPLPPLR